MCRSKEKRRVTKHNESQKGDFKDFLSSHGLSWNSQWMGWFLRIIIKWPNSKGVSIKMMKFKKILHLILTVLTSSLIATGKRRAGYIKTRNSFNCTQIISMLFIRFFHCKNYKSKCNFQKWLYFLSPVTNFLGQIFWHVCNI